MSLNQPLVWRNPVETEVASQLAHVKSELCWCDPIVEMDEYVKRLLCTRRSRGIELPPVKVRARDGGELIGKEAFANDQPEPKRHEMSRHERDQNP